LLLAVSKYRFLKFIFTSIIILLSGLLLLQQNAAGQLLIVKGTVYDSSRLFTMNGVSVLTSSGKGTSTDANGKYELLVPEKDTIWFSYLNKATVKYPVANMANPMQFEISLHVNIPTLKEVVLRPRVYKLDSLQNRIDYAKIFDWRRPNIASMTSIGPNGAGISISELIRVFQFRKNRSNEAFQQRLLKEEQEKFIDHRFSKALVLKLTGLTGDARDSFMLLYRPSYVETAVLSDYDFQYRVKQNYLLYKQEMKFRKAGGEMKKEGQKSF
jgi:hypothetical protein